MAIVLNLVALILVVGICWAGMMWLAGRAHGHTARGTDEWVITEVRSGDKCPECDGIGAKPTLGSLKPCPLCEGTGIYTSIS